MQSEDYFINSSGHTDINGYWEPHSSSIDFCETNYLLSSHVVEPHNVLSSLWGIALFGIIGIKMGNPTGETRFKIAYIILLLIGIGSAALHGTLHWVFQSADELPMIYLVVSALYCCLENDTPPQQKPKYPWVPQTLMALCSINTVIYFRFQKIYAVFLFTFIVLTTIGSILHVQIALRQRLILSGELPSDKETSNDYTESEYIHRTNARIALRFYKWHYVVYLGIASPVWALDQLWCEQLQPVYDGLPHFLKGCTLHVVWHATAGLGAYTILQFLVACRMSVFGWPCRIKWIFGAVPVIEKDDKKVSKKL